MTLGPRIYNLFPLLVGSVQDWSGHLARIAGMQFDWVFLNPIHYPGFSGSLYAVKDPYRLHDRFQGGASESPDDLIRGFCGRADQHGMRVMLDLVVNHTAKDSVLAEQQHLFAAKYLPYLPSEDELKRELERERDLALRQLARRHEELR